MPIGPNCRSCGAPLPPDVGWCSRCLTPVTLFSPREPVHEVGGYVGAPVPTVRTSRWRAGPTTFGPAGRILCTVAIAALFPWWGLGNFNPLFLWALMGWLVTASIFLRSIWKPTRIMDPAPTRGERFRARHPRLGRELRLPQRAGVAVLFVAVGAAIIAWLAMDEGARYLWAVVAIVSGVGFFLASWNDL